MSIEIKSEDVKRLKLRYVGSITEAEIPRLKGGTFFLRTNSSDLAGEVFGKGRRNVYVYKAGVKEELA